MMRWEGFNADGGAAVRWHEMNRDAARADSFGVAERGNAVLRPQMTSLVPVRQRGADPLAGLGNAAGCAIVTGATERAWAQLSCTHGTCLQANLCLLGTKSGWRTYCAGADFDNEASWRSCRMLQGAWAIWDR